MALLLHTGNDLEVLGDRLIAHLGEGLRGGGIDDALRTRIVMVPTPGLRDWLRQRIAERLGICAGIELCYPAGLREALRRHAGVAAPESGWERETARWECLRLLPEVPALAGYLGDDGPSRRAYDLAGAIVDCFERYALYRPDATLIPWNEGRTGPHDADAPWQPELWRRLRATAAGDPLADREALIAAIAAAGEVHDIYAFGFNAMAPGLLAVVAALAEVCDVHVASLQPTWGYWGEDQRRLRDLVQNRVPACDWGNRLLGDWGSIGRDFLRALDDAGAAYTADPDDYRIPGGENLLARIQRDLVAARAADESPPHPLRADDDSLHVHACHSLRRQLEVTKAAIHAAFERDPDLRPHHVAVMTPDPETVAPAAAALFAGDDHGPPIAVAIGDPVVRAGEDAIAVLLRLCELLPSRFAAGDVIDFVGCAPVARAWGLGADELDRLRAWIDAADLRWGVDADHRRDCVGHRFAAGSWRRGLQRLYLSWWHGADADAARAFRGGDGDPAEAVVPVDGFEPESFATLERLGALLAPIFDAASAARAGESPRGWCDRLARLLRHVLRRRDDDPDLAIVVAELATWADGLENVGWREALAPEVLIAAFEERFAHRGGGEFGRGAVTVCGMQPMRSVPFKMLCLVGMDDGAFPREHRAPDFDLLHRHPRPGDRDLRNEDRYLLLELLVSTRDRCCITYRGFDPRDKTPLPPAVPVGELIDCAARSFGASRTEAEEALVVVHRLHGSLDPGERWPSDAVREEHRALTGVREGRGREGVELADDPGGSSLELEDLLAFWRCPARIWLSRLGIRTPEVEEPPRDHERFVGPAGLDRYHCRRRYLEAEDPAGLRERFAAEGRLPAGAPARQAWRDLAAAVDGLRERRRSLLEECDARGGECVREGVALAAEFAAVHPRLGAVRVHPGKRNARLELDCWIRAVIARATGVADRASCLHLDGKDRVEEFSLEGGGDAHLATLLAGFVAGGRRPLPFAPETSREYARRRWFAKTPCDEAEALGQAATVWEDPRNPRAEGRLPAHRLLWPPPEAPTSLPEFGAWAERIWRPLLEATR